MSALNLLYSFRLRLLLVLIALLVSTLGVQYFLGRRAGQERARILSEQERALTLSFSLGIESLSSGSYLKDIYNQKKLHFLDEPSYPVTNILVVTEEGKVTDSLDDAYAPKTLPNKTDVFKNISQVPLPP